jgi:Asp-tRNA(Asn)/Glu-tRNA(Gln) amidotransferase A subunit family amidase
MNDLTGEDACYLPVARQRELFRSGAMNPAEVLEHQISRIEQLNGSLNAITESFYDEARREAHESGRRYAAGTERPLEGITIALKEEQPVRGRPLTLGSAALPGEVSLYNHPIVDRIREAGGVIHLRTTTPEFCAAGFTQSRLWGVTRNAWNVEFASGGSSGGSAVALAAGFTTLATGSDIAGSLRIPSAFNGVVGYKAPFGVVPAIAPVNLDGYCHDGAMGRSVRDCVALHEVIAGQHPDDMSSTPIAPIGDSVFSDSVAGLPVGVMRTLGDYPVSADVADGMQRAVDALTAAGAQVVELTVDWSMKELTEAAFAHYGMIMAPMIREAFGDKYDGAESYTKDFVETSERALAKLGSYAPVVLEGRIQADLLRAFRSVRAIVCPTTAVPALQVANEYADHRLSVDGRSFGLVHHLQAALTIPFNMASRLPVFAVPSGRADTGVPTSVQVAAAPYDQRTAAVVADVIGSSLPWYQSTVWRPQKNTPTSLL